MTPQLAVGPASKVDAIAKELRLFKAGINSTLEADYLFDTIAADSVMRAWARWNVPIQFDLEHLSLDPKAPNYLSDSFGSCSLAVRSGELWAIAIKFTPQAIERIVDGRQRFVSPTMYFDAQNQNRVTEIFCLGLVAKPQTLGAQPLLAASRLPRGLSISDAQICRRTGCSPQMWARLSAERASLSAEVIWDPKQNPELLRIAKERGLQGSFAEIKAQIEAQQVRDAQLAEAFGCTVGEIELTRSRLKLRTVILSPEEKRIAAEIGCLESVFAWNKSIKESRS